MTIDTQIINLDGHKLVFRSADKEDAAILLPYLKRSCGETRFLSREPDECSSMTLEQEESFIKSHKDSDRACLILAELDGEYIGNASFDAIGPSRRNRHRAELGIALYLAYTGMGIGKKLFALLIDTARKAGFESVELDVVSDNHRARHMYESFGFVETGRIPNANKYDDGSYSDTLHMIKKLK